MTSDEANPYGSHRFEVSCDVLPPIGFTEVRGLSVAVDNGGDADSTTNGNRVPRGRPGKSNRRTGDARKDSRGVRSPPLELERGVTDEQALWEWFQQWADGDIEPQDVRICLLDTTGAPVRGWVCRAARPVRWTGPHLVANSVSVATETLEVTHEGIEALVDLSQCTSEQ
ncbi:phage tail protein [Haloferax sp. YSMS24]|uniref:phage tail protein n=1 Tax=Haloferax sp. YSMS24 TaxID=3388425 RepID=UPI00398D24AF